VTAIRLAHSSSDLTNASNTFHPAEAQIDAQTPVTCHTPLVGSRWAQRHGFRCRIAQLSGETSDEGEMN